MNANCYKVIFSKRLGALVAVGEHTTCSGKAAAGQSTRTLRASGDFISGLKLCAAAVLLVYSPIDFAVAQTLASNTLPTHGVVQTGAATMSTNGANMVITQSTDKASINWQSFSIGSSASVNIAQPSANSVLLNRVVGNDPSQIFGKLSANGQVILLNPNGILFGKDGSVTASTFTASTFALSDADFMSGHYKYTRNGSTAAVVNQGTIETSAGGFVALIGATVTNEGTIRAHQGDVVLAAAETVTLPTPNPVSVRMSKRVRLELDPAAINTAVSNTDSGIIVTEGGQVLLQAAALSSAVASVTHTGTIDTSGAQGGAVTLLADHGHIKVSGSITANSADASNKGGDIIIGRDEVTGALATTTDVSGAKLESQGGFIETSGHDLKVDGAQIKAANWLLDPDNIDITGDASSATAGYSKIKASDIATALNAGTNVTVATTTASQVNQPAYVGSAVTGDGNILVNAAIVKSGSNNASLTLLADNGITVNQRVGKASGDTTSTCKLDVTMTSGGVASVTATSLGMTLNNVIDANGGTVTLTGTTSNATQNGVTFANGSGISAATYTVTGTNTSTTGGAAGSAQAAGVLFKGTTSLTSTTGASTVTGDTRNTNGYGVMFYPGTSTLDAGNGSLTVGTASTSVMGTRSGWGGSSTINTKGNVTLGSKNNDKSDLAIQGVINAQSGTLTLLGKSSATNGIALWDGGGQVPKVLATNGASITMDGESSKAGSFGVILAVANQAVISTDTGAISITGTSSGSTGIYTQNNTSISSSNGGNITLTGNATGSGGGVGINLTSGTVTTTGQVELNGTAITNAGVLNNATVSGGSVLITGTASSTGGGISSGGTITATAGNVTLNGTSSGLNNGVYSSAAITSNTGDINITGTSVTGGGVVLQGTVTAQNNVTINGTSSSTASSNQGVVIQHAVKANTGDITVTGNTNSNVQRAVAVTVNGANSGSLQTVASGRNININADTLLINTGSTVDSGSAGTVTIKTTTNGGAVGLGSVDTVSSTASSRVLGLEQAEFDRITAGKLLIGDSTTGGNITIGAAVTTLDATGDVSLLSHANISVNGAFKAGTTGTKKLTLNAAGTSGAVTQTASITASGLELLGNTASYTLTNTGNTVQTLAANTASLNYVNAAALSINTVNTTTGINATGNVTVKTLAGDLTLNQNITTAGTLGLEAFGAIARVAGTLNANTLNLKAGTTIGTSASRIQSNVSSLSLDSAGDQYLTEVDAVTVAAKTTNNGSTNITTTNGTLTVGAVNSITGITANGTGNVTLTGHSSTATGIDVLNAITASGGTATLTGTTDANTRPNNTAYAGIRNASSVNAQTIALTGTATDTSADVLGYYGAGGSLIASATLTATASSAGGGAGFYMYSGTTQSGTGMSITGTSNTGYGIALEGNSQLNNQTSGGISLSGTTNAAAPYAAILLNGNSITNSNGGVTLTSNGGNIRTANTNAITGSGAIAITAGQTAVSTEFIDATSLTITQTGNANTTVRTTGTGNVTTPKVINNGSGNVTIAAGSAIAAGTTTGGHVLTVSGNTITQASTGKTYIYTGSASNTGKLSNLDTLHANFDTLYYEGTSHALNTAFNTAYNSTIAGGSDWQVLFRDTTVPSFTLTLPSAQVHKTYGQSDPTLADVRNAIQTAYTTANSATTLTTAVAGVGGSNTFGLTAADAIAALTGNRATGESVSGGPYAYSLSASTLNTTVAGTAPVLVVDKATLNASLIGTTTKQYDGLTSATLSNSNYSLTGWVGSEGATVTQTAGAYADPNVVNNTLAGKGAVSATFSASNFTGNAGTDLGNYILPTSASGNIGVITPAPLTIKVNNTSAFVTQDARNAADQGFSYTGFKNTDNENTALTGVYTRTYSNGGNNTPIVGTYNGVYGLSATPTAVNGNYTISVQNGNLTVIPADKLLITINSQTDVYGNRTATNAGVAANGTVSAEYCLNQLVACTGANIVQLTMTQMGSNQWKATDNTNSYVVFDTSLSSPSYSSGDFLNVGNYTYTASEITPLSLPHGNFTGRVTNGGVLTVTALGLNPSASGVSKTYDGGTSLVGIALTPTGVLAGDAVTASAATGTFNSANAGTNIGFILSGLALAGSDAANYSLAANTLNGNGSITAKQLTLSGAAVANKAYDGGTSATLTNNGSLQGLIGNETLNLTNLSAAFTSPTVGNNKAVAVSATLANGTGLASNYTLATTTVYANITGNKPPDIKPPLPILPSDTASSQGSESVGAGNPYLVLPSAPQNADRCTSNNLEACLCESDDTALEGVAICYQPQKTALAKDVKKKI